MRSGEEEDDGEMGDSGSDGVQGYGIWFGFLFNKTASRRGDPLNPHSICWGDVLLSNELRKWAGIGTMSMPMCRSSRSD